MGVAQKSLISFKKNPKKKSSYYSIGYPWLIQPHMTQVMKSQADHDEFLIALEPRGRARKLGWVAKYESWGWHLFWKKASKSVKAFRKIPQIVAVASGNFFGTSVYSPGFIQNQWENPQNRHWPSASSCVLCGRHHISIRRCTKLCRLWNWSPCACHSFQQMPWM